MKHLNLFVISIAFTLIFSSSCNTYKSMSSVTKISELRGNPFMYQLSKAVVKNLGSYAMKAGVKNIGKINLLSNLSSIFTTSDQVAGLKDLLTLSYKISPKKVNADFGKLTNVKDLIGFIAKNGRGFNFYSSNSSL
ncbi:MAG: hypothetical protein IPK62_10570 [Bacteroidetes bacterium]|nr:hypothetical protein [Bacteroidota bacterium]MBK8145391.1 hypothetical protein [Bacteroidota bacterium]